MVPSYESAAAAKAPANTKSQVVGNREAALPAAMELKMARARLGIVYGLYLALRAKHPPTAMHSLRVALGCSKWAAARGMSEADRDVLEVAALLHDLGKIAVPDRVLHKTTQLGSDELSLMDLHVQVGLELLRGAGASNELLEIVGTYRQWYHQPNQDGQPAPPPPVAARMIAIVDAFDSMTSEQVFRRALSRERAIAEMFECAGTQFDPEMLKQFSLLLNQSTPELENVLVRRWLNELRPQATPGFWETELTIASGATQTLVDTVYHRRLLEAMHDAAVYVDCSGTILHWNRSAERMTGRNAATMMHKVWAPEMMGLVDEKGQAIQEDHCPMREVLASQVTASRKLEVRHRDGRTFKIQLNVLPVTNNQRLMCGAIVLARDASAQATLEERCQTLHEKATRDPLTGVNNRAEMDRRLAEFVPDHLSNDRPGALIICDIDHFKRINDNYGHQAGDEALVVFAGILRELAREKDLVARYGGEEFVVLCEDCDNATATSRAEEIRRAVERRGLPSLRGNNMTASFGVTEVQAGDTDETLLARADRALLLAKETGRNRVIQLGSGQREIPVEPTASGWFGWFKKQQSGEAVLNKQYLTPMPLDVAAEKLGGFISDHKATVVSTGTDEITLKIDCRQKVQTRRMSDRPTEMLLHVKWTSVEVTGRRGFTQTKTKLDIGIGAPKGRDRRMAAVHELAAGLLSSLQAYIGAEEIDDQMRLKYSMKEID